MRNFIFSQGNDFFAGNIFQKNSEFHRSRMGVKEVLIKSLSDFATSIMMQDKEKDDANSELFKESFAAVLHHYAAKSDSSI